MCPSNEKRETHRRTRDPVEEERVATRCTNRPCFKVGQAGKSAARFAVGVPNRPAARSGPSFPDAIEGSPARGGAS
eukprot:1194579-Prorocentrum_minimum.AAC.5